MLDVVDKQLLMLHLVLEPKPPDRQNLIRIIARRNLFDEPKHLFIDVRAIVFGFSDSWARARSALGTFNARTKPFVIGIEEEKKIFRVDFVARLELLQDRLKEP